MRSVVIGSIATAWSDDDADRSPVRSPSSSTSRRSPLSPRSTGRAGRRAHGALRHPGLVVHGLGNGAA